MIVGTGINVFVKVQNAAARLALPTPYTGMVYQVDTDVLYVWSTATNAWVVVGIEEIGYPTVANYAALPAAAGHTGEIYTVVGGAGTFPFTYYPAGLYYCDGATWEYMGEYPNLLTDDNFGIRNGVDFTKIVTIDASGVGTGQSRSIQMADRDIDLNYCAETYHGVVTLPTPTDNGDGTISITAGVANFSTMADGVSGYVVRLATPAAVNIALTDQTVNYVYADYNSGTPSIGVVTTPTGFLSDGRLVPLFRVIREGTDLCILDYDAYGIALADKTFYKDIALNGIQRSSGLLLKTAATRISTIEAGAAWFGVSLVPLAENVAGVNSLCEFYLTSGVWGKNVVSDYDSSYYSDGTDRQALGASKWVSKYFFRSIGTTANQAVYTHGNEYSTQSGAVNELVPAIPPIVSATCVYVGKIVIQEGATNGTAYPREWEGAVMSSGAVNHNDLQNRDAAGSHSVITPLADSTAAFKITKADGTTPILNVDSTNTKVDSYGIISYNENKTFTADTELITKKYVADENLKNVHLTGDQEIDGVKIFSDYPKAFFTDDWFLPSKDELNLLYTELHTQGVGDFTDTYYWSSSELDAGNGWAQSFSSGVTFPSSKNNLYRVRAVREFTDTAGKYSVRDVGPSGGLIFYASGTTYMEAAPADYTEGATVVWAWSNIDSPEIGVTAQGTAVGTGSTNSAAIVGQAGHTVSAASKCLDYVGSLPDENGELTNKIYVDILDAQNVKLTDVNYITLTDSGATTLHKHDHDNMDGIDAAASGVTHGHITDQAQTIAGSKSFAGVLNADGKIKIPAGAVDAVSIYSGTDTNTGPWYPAADTWAVSAGGSNRLNVDTTGVTEAKTSLYTHYNKYIGVQSGTYKKTVILLHEIYVSTNLDLNMCVGSIIAGRGSTTAANRIAEATIKTSSAYNTTLGTIYSTPDLISGASLWKLVTCDYNSKKYLAVELPYISAQFLNGLLFKGYAKSTGELLLLVDYYDVNTSSVLNAEINSSIADFVPNLFHQFGSSIKIGNSDAARGTTTGTNQLSLFDGTAPEGTLATGISLYSSSGEFYAMNSSGVANKLTGNISVPAGAVDAPSIYSGTDTNTGPWFPAADTFAISTGGVKRLSIEPDGARIYQGQLKKQVVSSTLFFHNTQKSVFSITTPANSSGTYTITIKFLCTYPTAGTPQSAKAGAVSFTRVVESTGYTGVTAGPDVVFTGTSVSTGGTRAVNSVTWAATETSEQVVTYDVTVDMTTAGTGDQTARIFCEIEMIWTGIGEPIIVAL